MATKITKEQLNDELRYYFERAQKDLDKPTNFLSLHTSRWQSNSVCDEVSDREIFCPYPLNVDEIWDFVKDYDYWELTFYENEGFKSVHTEHFILSWELTNGKPL